MIRSLIGAVQFLTVLRLPGGIKPSTPGQAAAWFPLVGAALGAGGAGIFLASRHGIPIGLAALTTVVFWTAASAVLKDSRIGTFGAVAIALSIVARWQALEFMIVPNVVAACIAAQAVPRAAMVGMAWVSRPAGTGLGYALCSTLSTPAALFAIAQGIAAALACGVRTGVLLILGSYLIARLVRWYFYRRLGGVNGDCLGATEQLIEIFALVLFTVKL